MDFWQVTEDALVFAAKMLKLELSIQKRRQLMHAYLEIKAWPDALPALRSFMFTCASAFNTRWVSSTLSAQGVYAPLDTGAQHQ